MSTATNHREPSNAELAAAGTTNDRVDDALPGQPRRGFGHWAATVGWKYLLALVALVYAGFPLLYVLSASLNPDGTLTGSNQLFRVLKLDNYVKLLTIDGIHFKRWYWNTLVIAVATSIGTVFIGALAAYAFSRMRFAGRRIGLMSLVLVQMFPQMLAFVALFLLLVGIGRVFPFLGLGTKTGLIMVYLGGALGVNTYLMYGFFNTVPQSLDEAARVDGAGHARIFFTIILRLVAPILSVIALLAFIGVFGEIVISSMLLPRLEDKTLATGLYTFVQGGDRNQNWPLFSAGAVMAALPPMVLFFALQKYIVSGLTAGAVK